MQIIDISPQNRCF